MEHVSIDHEEDGGLYQFVLRINGERLGFLDYAPTPAGEMRIDYVEVDPALRGGGHGRKLVEAAVAFARERHWRVVPICSYARAVIERDPVLSTELRR